MGSYNKYLILAVALFLLLSVSSVSANNLENATIQIEGDNSSSVLSNGIDDAITGLSDEITVENWDDLQYYCLQNDKNYVLKLKENTNFRGLNF